MLGASCVAILALAGACNDLVGVDFGEAHLAEAGSGGGSPPLADAGHKDATGVADAHAKDAAPDSRKDSADATKDAHPASDASEGTDGSPDAPPDSATCSPSGAPSTEPCVITEAYGVFVAPPGAGGDDTNGDGSRAHPYATVGHGVMAAGSKRVYVCAATYPESLAITVANDGVQVYGGLACPEPEIDAGPVDAGPVDAQTDAPATLAAWSYTGAQPTLAPFAPGYALDVEQLTVGAHFEDVGFRAQGASPLAGSSASIAIRVNGSAGVSFTRVTARSGAGLPGAALGPLPTNDCVTNLTGGEAVMTTPGAGTVCTCPALGVTMGGNGVAASHITALSDNGSATPPPTVVVAPHDGLAGKSGAVIGSCTVGDVGAPGAPGTAGSAGQASSLAANAGTAGTPGDPGQGGGGGGSVTYAGGGGGGGGCGGNGGAGGSGGGASIAVHVTMSTVSLTSVVLLAGAGGVGVDGQAGDPGQAGGAGGSAAAFGINQGCAGGAGGTGGSGAGGGGGAGGISAGVAWTGVTPPTIDGQPIMTAASLPTSIFTSGGAGTGGAGGPGGAASAGGVAAPAGAAGPPGLAGAIIPL